MNLEWCDVVSDDDDAAGAEVPLSLSLPLFATVLLKDKPRLVTFQQDEDEGEGSGRNPRWRYEADTRMRCRANLILGDDRDKIIFLADQMKMRGETM